MYRDYPECIEHNTSTVGKMLKDAKDFFDVFPEHRVFHYTSGPDQRYNITRNGNTYKVIPATR